MSFTHADDDETAGGDFVSQEVVSGQADPTDNRKHLLLKVPDYEKATGSVHLLQKNSLLQMGDATEVTDIDSNSTAGGNDLLAFAFDNPARVTAATAIAFLDDVRFRGTEPGVGGTPAGALATPPSEEDPRDTANGVDTTLYSAPGATSDGGEDSDRNAAVSAAIPEYVGWRDHTDGHRITTTRGDKIEVIGGNYKIVSLGRGTGMASYEMSGGIIIDAMEAPGNLTSVTLRECPTEALTAEAQPVADEVRDAYLAYRLNHDSDGTEDEWFDNYPFDGSADNYHTHFSDDYADDLKRAVETLVAETTNAKILGRDDYHSESGGDRLRAAIEAWNALTGPLTSPGWKAVAQTVMGNEVSRFQGTQREEFYGDKLISVTGSPTVVPTTIGVDADKDGSPETYIGDTSAYTAAKTVGSLSSYAYPTRWDQRGGLPTKLQQPDIYESTWAKSVTEYTEVSGDHVEETHYKGDHRTETWVDGLIKDVFHGDHMEHFYGTKTEMFLGATTTLGLANRLELFIGAEEQMNVGLQLSIAVGPQMEIETLKNVLWLNDAGAGISKFLGTVDDNEVGLKKTNSALKKFAGSLAKDDVNLKRTALALKTDL